MLVRRYLNFDFTLTDFFDDNASAIGSDLDVENDPFEQLDWVKMAVIKLNVEVALKERVKQD